MIERIKSDRPTGKKRGGFKKGMEKHPLSGRKPGVQNFLTGQIKDSVVQAAIEYGSNGRGKDGLKGYMLLLARLERKSFATLLCRVLPLQINSKHEHEHQHTVRTEEEIVKMLQDRGINPDAISLDKTQYSSDRNPKQVAYQNGKLDS